MNVDLLANQWAEADTPSAPAPSGRRLLGTNDRAPIELFGVGQRDLAARLGRQHVGVRRELHRLEARIERDLDLFPDGVEPVPLNGVEDRDEIQALVRARVALVDSVEGLVVVQIGLQQLEVDREDLAVIEGWHVAARAVRVAGIRGAADCQDDRQANEEAHYPLPHIAPPSLDPPRGRRRSARGTSRDTDERTGWIARSGSMIGRTGQGRGDRNVARGPGPAPRPPISLASVWRGTPSLSIPPRWRQWSGRTDGKEARGCTVVLQPSAGRAEIHSRHGAPGGRVLRDHRRRRP